MPLVPSRRLARRVVAVALGAVLAGPAACTAGGGPAGPTGVGSEGRSGVPSGGPPTGVRPSPTGPDDPASEVAAALDRLLAAREAALTAGDRAAYARTVLDPGSPAGQRQLAAFRAARALGVTRLAHDIVAPVDDPAAADVTVHYRVDGVDRADRSSTVRYAVVRRAGGWRIAAEAPTGADAAPAWLAMPDLAVRRGPHAVVAGTADDAALRAVVATVDRALPALAGSWPGTPARTLVLVPDTAAETDALRGAGGPAVGDVAATTDGPTDATGRATGDRVVLDPDARRRLTPAGRDVVLTHELAHVAVRATVAGAPPTWLSEGYADHVGYARAGLSQSALAAPLLAALRAGTAPTSIPSSADLDPAVSDIEVGYLAAWQAAETVVDLRGEGGLRALVRTCASTGGEDAAEQRCTSAMPRVLGVDRAGLTRRWRQRIEALGG